MPAALQVLFVIAVLVALALGVAIVVWATRSLRYIPNNRVGIVEKLWSRSGSVQERPHRAAAARPASSRDVLRGGWHFLMPFQYRVHKMPLVTIPQGKIGYVFARDGQPLPPTQTLAAQRARRATSRTSAAFLRDGGQRARSARILREGTYAINLAQFVVHHRAARVYYLPLDRDEDERVQADGAT